MLQTRLPSQIVVIDASLDWKQHHARMLSELDWPSAVSLIYQPARIRSLTAQRNQALALATSDIVFSLDDDIFLYPDAAEIIMKVYEADSACEVSMVTGNFTFHPYGQMEKQASRAVPVANRGLASQVNAWLEAQMTMDSHFVPYGVSIDRGPVPISLAPLNVFPCGLINGGRTTFRRKIGVEVRWSEFLRYYATHEDSDFSYRMSAHGRLVVAPDAKLFHADGNEGRLSRYQRNCIRTCNLAALHVAYSGNRLGSFSRCFFSFFRYMSIYVMIDLAKMRVTLPSARGYAYGIVHLPLFFLRKRSTVQQWYLAKQEKMYEDWKNASSTRAK